MTDQEVAVYDARGMLQGVVPIGTALPAGYVTTAPGVVAGPYLPGSELYLNRPTFAAAQLIAAANTQTNDEWNAAQFAAQSAAATARAAAAQAASVAQAQAAYTATAAAQLAPALPDLGGAGRLTDPFAATPNAEQAPGTAAVSTNTVSVRPAGVASPTDNAAMPPYTGPELKPMSSLTMQPDLTHKYVGTDNRGDVYQLFDGNNVIEWAVKVGDDSRTILPGTLVNLGPPSKMTVAQAPAAAAVNVTPPTPVTTQTQTLATPAAVQAGATVTTNAAHKYVGTDARGDVYQMFDGSRVLEWAVKVGDDSRAMLPGTLRDLGAPSANTVAQAGTTATAATVAATAPTNTQIGTTGAASLAAGVPGATSDGTAAASGDPSLPPKSGDVRHVYVGRDARGDVWQLFDGANVVEWAVPAGADSREIIFGSSRNLGAPSGATVAQANIPGGTQTAPGTAGNTAANASGTTPAAAGGTIGWLAIVGAVISVLK